MKLIKYDDNDFI